MSIINNISFFRDSISIEESQVENSKAKDPFGIIPREVVSLIFSYLNLHDLGVSRRVSKKWMERASQPDLWKAVICRELAFSSKNWAQWNADIVKGVDFAKEHLSLPPNIVEELRRSYNAFPGGKSIKETHLLVRMPKGLTLNKLGELAKEYFPNNRDGYRFIGSEIVTELGDKSADEFAWMLMTKEVLPESRRKNYDQQKKMIEELVKKTGIPYQVPTTLEAATCILADYSRSEKRLFSDSPRTYTRCQESIQGYRVFVGGFAPAGLLVNNSFLHDSDSCGVAALREF
jgi:hypothetical protein